MGFVSGVVDREWRIVFIKFAFRPIPCVIDWWWILSLINQAAALVEIPLLVVPLLLCKGVKVPLLLIPSFNVPKPVLLPHWVRFFFLYLFTLDLMVSYLKMISFFFNHRSIIPCSNAPWRPQVPRGIPNETRPFWSPSRKDLWDDEI